MRVLTLSPQTHQIPCRPKSLFAPQLPKGPAQLPACPAPGQTVMPQHKVTAYCSGDLGGVACRCPGPGHLQPATPRRQTATGHPQVHL